MKARKKTKKPQQNERAAHSGEASGPVDLAGAERLFAGAGSRLIQALQESELREAAQSADNKQMAATIDALRAQNAHLQIAVATLGGAKDSAEKANRAKTDLLATASHDLRQPLDSMRLLLRALPRGDLEAPNHEILSQLEDAVEFMGRLLASLLDLSRLDVGAVEPKLVNFAVGDLLTRLERLHRPLVLEKAIDCRFVLSSAVIRSDPDLLAEILQNLISNAIRHCARGRILIGCRRCQADLRIEVWDNGEGIPEAELDSVFREFHQVGSPQRGPDRGLGLGLAIVDRLAGLMGHRVDVRSTAGQGTAFGIEVPLATDGNASNTAPAPGATPST